MDAIVTTGGTGLTGRDVTPEALEPLFDKVIDGFSVVFHMVSYQTVGLSTLQSRALAGIVRGVFVFCLPGSNGAVKDGWDKVIRWQLDSRHRPWPRRHGGSAACPIRRPCARGRPRRCG